MQRKQPAAFCRCEIFFLRYLLSGLIFFVAISSAAQQNDSVPAKDTLALYKKIKKVAGRHKLTLQLFNVVFADPAPAKYIPVPLSDDQKKVSKVQMQKGATIRKVEIEVLDPFGYSVNDTTPQKINPFQKLGNH